MYHKVLGTKNPSDILTKHVPAELLDRHLGTMGVQVQDGRAESAPELNTMEVESWVQWLPAEGESDEEGNGKARREESGKESGKGEKKVESKVERKEEKMESKVERKEEKMESKVESKVEKKVRFGRSIQLRAIPWMNRGMKCGDRSKGWTCRRASTGGGVPPEAKPRWADLTDEEEAAKTTAVEVASP